MRVRFIPAAIALACCMVGVSGCGLQSNGLYIADGGSQKLSTGSGGDAAPVGSSSGDDVDGAGDPPPDPDGSATSDADSMDAATGDPSDGSLQPPGDSGPPNGGVDAAPLTCHECAALKCPTQLAACGPGSNCIAYRDCDLSCTGSGNTCAKTCSTTYPGGESAFTALTVCDIPCGGSCVAQVSFGTP
jgi:hypothetical protein